ncbi:hypothetical protein AWL63_00160 [Sphingomonas panacis]|uniref:Uncharacterized protein n=1 Tax=Sphingomonas panacis TaxID=1560345 RepID=A0A1B3Z5C7_9SPHN|nr:hypothetical protein [Sphingomonas panacis]AOH82633.1 hypothetical protein AWL63_00160 [Sphingomonas panacis]
MVWVARIVLFVPALIAGWFVSRDDASYWVIALAIALVFIALTAVAGMYFPRDPGRARRPDA